MATYHFHMHTLSAYWAISLPLECAGYSCTNQIKGLALGWLFEEEALAGPWEWEVPLHAFPRAQVLLQTVLAGSAL